MGVPVGYVNVYNPATSIFPTADGRGYWVAAARGDVFPFGNAPFMGSMSASGLNASIIAGSASDATLRRRAPVLPLGQQRDDPRHQPVELPPVVAAARRNRSST